MEPTFDLIIDRAPACFRPGESLEGVASWQGVANIRSAVLRLFWTTSGRGTSDTAVVLVEDLTHPRSDDTRRFAFILPAGPPGFCGTLITLRWGVELVIEPGEKAIHREFVFGPEATVICLPELAQPLANKLSWLRPR